MIIDLLEKLCAVPNFHGGDYMPPEEFAKNYLSKLGDLKTDINGNIICIIGSGSKKILLDAHLDKIGFVVTGIESGGFLKIAKSGGVDVRLLPGQPVYVMGNRPLYGIITNTPPHLQKSADKVRDIDELYIDTGLCTTDASDLIALGDNVYFCTETARLTNGRFTASALDDRAGVCVMLTVADMFYKNITDFDCELHILLSNQEELGCRGAVTGAFTENADEAIVVDVSFGNAPGIKKTKSGKLGFGAMIGVSPTLDQNMTKALIEVARESNIKFQTEVMGGETGTNADVISPTAGGVKTALISIPLRGMHTPVEVIDEKDIKSVADIIYNYLRHTCKKGGADL